ncbi:hypothetical protein GCM10009772_13290 [Pseudonocardia alni subsp. carboxydivorans]
MRVSARELTIMVNAGSDPRRRARSAEELLGVLSRDPAFVEAGLSAREPRLPAPPDGAKGAAELVGVAGTLAVVGKWYLPPAAEVLKSVLGAWCARDRRISVTVTEGDRSLTFTGSPGPEERALIDRFFEHASEDRPAGDAPEAGERP